MNHICSDINKNRDTLMIDSQNWFLVVSQIESIISPHLQFHFVYEQKEIPFGDKSIGNVHLQCKFCLLQQGSDRISLSGVYASSYSKSSRNVQPWLETTSAIRREAVREKSVSRQPWAANWWHLINTFVYHSTFILRGLMGVLNYAPILSLGSQQKQVFAVPGFSSPRCGALFRVNYRSNFANR